MRNIDSTRFLEQMDMYLDNQLSQHEQQDFLKEMESNPKSQKMMENEIQFRNFIKQNVKRPEVPSSIINGIISKFKE
ncbi:MAG: hypothetical protein J5I52_08565 [Saprospiraceae bacterium]|nr:MAG: hypothetical protein UZ09_BCD002000375 [Bacteroidetes bacterium OLB9]MCO6464188.1 hypothetical protein [Saprospiraceae bacterium]MCZ2338953.1 hypothetical protein [Chitinophagales bacterium]